jgi:hypothetical protein
MSRLIDERVVIESGSDGLPSRFAWRQRWHRISDVLEAWRDIGCWWNGEGEKEFYLFQADTGGIYELYHDCRLQQWHLYRVLD